MFEEPIQKLDGNMQAVKAHTTTDTGHTPAIYRCGLRFGSICESDGYPVAVMPSFCSAQVPSVGVIAFTCSSICPSTLFG